MSVDRPVFWRPRGSDGKSDPTGCDPCNWSTNSVAFSSEGAQNYIYNTHVVSHTAFQSIKLHSDEFPPGSVFHTLHNYIKPTAITTFPLGLTVTELFWMPVNLEVIPLWSQFAVFIRSHGLASSIRSPTSVLHVLSLDGNTPLGPSHLPYLQKLDVFCKYVQVTCRLLLGD